jgi:pilus assembly protein CpaB
MTPALRRLLAVAVALILAIVGVTSVVSYANRADERALGDQQPTAVLIVTQAIPRGTPSEGLGDSVSSTLVPATAAASGAVEDLEELAGLVAAVDLVPGEQLLASRFVTVEELEAPQEVPVPAGLQEISFLLPMDRVLGGRIEAGDLVGVIATLDGMDVTDGSTEGTDETDTVTALLIDRLLITFVQYSDAPIAALDAAAPVVPSGELLVTFAVDTVTAERLTFAFDQGRVRLTRLTSRTEQTGPTGTSRENIFG